MYTATIFFFLIGIIAIRAFAILIYQHSFFIRLSPANRLPIWERCIYYFIAAYPFVSYIILKPAGDYFKHAGIAPAAVQQQFAIFIVCHIPLTILSLVVVRHLIKRSKLNIAFAISNSLVGGMYIAGALVLMMR